MAEQQKPKIEPLGPWGTAALQAGNGALFGYLPEIVEMLPGSKEGDAQRIEQLMAASDAANPKASWAGFATGLALPGGLLKKGYGIAKPLAKPVLKGLFGIASDAGLWSGAKSIAKTVGPALGFGVGGYSMFGGGNGAQPPAGAPAGQADASNTNADTPQPDWYDQMADIAGIDRDTVKALVKRDGGMRLDVLQTLGGMRPRPPTYRDLAMSMILDGLNSQARDAKQSGDDAQKAAVQRRIEETARGILSLDPMTAQYPTDPAYQ